MTSTPHDLENVDGSALADAPTWTPMPLGGYVDGTIRPPAPELMVREDGVKLLYRGHVHSVAGESESGKSMLMQAVAAEALADGERVLYLDFESDPATVVGRLLALGADPEALRTRFDYVQPSADPHGTLPEAGAFHTLCATTYGLAVVDGVTEALSLSGASSMDNDEVTAWVRRVPRTLARTTGAAVVLIDHVTKATEGRGRFAIGAQAKLATLDGASYLVEPLAPLGVGMAGRLSIRVAKDRPGQVRGHGGTWRKSDRTQAVAVAVIDSTTPGQIIYHLEAPARELSPEEVTADADAQRRRKVLAYLQDTGKPQSLNQLTAAVPGRRTALRDAVEALVADHLVISTPGSRGAVLYSVPEAAGAPGPLTASLAPIEGGRDAVVGRSRTASGRSGTQWDAVVSSHSGDPGRSRDADTPSRNAGEGTP